MRHAPIASIVLLVACGLGTVGFGSTVDAQDVVVEEIRPASPTYEEIVGPGAAALEKLLGHAEEFRFDDSDLMPGALGPLPKPRPPEPDTSPVPTHVSPRPMVPIPR